MTQSIESSYRERTAGERFSALLVLGQMWPHLLHVAPTMTAWAAMSLCGLRPDGMPMEFETTAMGLLNAGFIDQAPIGQYLLPHHSLKDLERVVLALGFTYDLVLSPKARQDCGAIRR